MDKTYIKIINCDGDYVFCPESYTVYETGKENEYSLFDMYFLFREDEDYIQFPLEIRLEIVKRIILAYETGIEKEKRRTKSKICQLLDLES